MHAGEPLSRTCLDRKRPKTPPLDDASLEELLPRSERIEISGASHIVHEDNAPAYNTAVMSFVGTATNDG